MVLIMRNGTYIKWWDCQGVQMETEDFYNWGLTQQVGKGKFGLNLLVLARKQYRAISPARINPNFPLSTC